MSLIRPQPLIDAVQTSPGRHAPPPPPPPPPCQGPMWHLAGPPPPGPRLPQDGPRTRTQLVSHLPAPQTAPSKECGRALPRSPITSHQAASERRCSSCASIRLPAGRGGFPNAPHGYFHRPPPPPHHRPLGAPRLGSGPDAFCLDFLFSLFLSLSHY